MVYRYTYIHMNEYLKNNNSIMIFIDSLMHLMLSWAISLLFKYNIEIFYYILKKKCE